MIHLHLDAVGGIAGDMFVAALLDAFPEHEERTLSEARAALPPGTAAIGIRPEHLELVPADRAVLSGSARYTEALGAETLIHLARPAGETLTMRIAGSPEGIAPDAPLHLAAAPATIRAFDREGRAIVPT